MKRLMLLAALGISSFAFTGYSRGIALPTSHSDLAVNQPTDAQIKVSQRENRGRGERERRRHRDDERWRGGGERERGERERGRHGGEERRPRI